MGNGPPRLSVSDLTKIEPRKVPYDGGDAYIMPYSDPKLTIPADWLDLIKPRTRVTDKYDTILQRDEVIYKNEEKGVDKYFSWLRFKKYMGQFAVVYQDSESGACSCTCRVFLVNSQFLIFCKFVFPASSCFPCFLQLCKFVFPAISDVHVSCNFAVILQEISCKFVKILQEFLQVSCTFHDRLSMSLAYTPKSEPRQGPCRV